MRNTTNDEPPVSMEEMMIGSADDVPIESNFGDLTLPGAKHLTT